MPKRIPKSWKRKRRKLRIFLVLVFIAIIIGGFFLIRGKWFATGEVDAKKIIPQTYTQALEVSLGNKKLTVTPMAGNPVKVIQKDVRYIYEGAYKNTDVVQSIYPYKIKEELIFWGKGHPLEFRYKLGNLETFIIRKDEKGNIKFYDKEAYEKTGELSKIFTIPAPFVEDKVGERSFVDVESIIQGDLLIITINPDWISGAVYPVILDPTIEINVLNVYSHPSQGEDWVVEFVTKGKADLKIIPQDQATIDDDEFKSLSCLPAGEEGDGEIRTPQILAGDVIYYQNWECNGIGKVIHKTLKAGHHILKFEFSGVDGYAEDWAYNAPDNTFRVTEYYLTTGAFTGTTYDLTLNQDLVDDYFILIRGSKDGDAGSYPDNDYARVYEVPGGTGELGDSGASNVIALSRHVADFNWEGVVTVVECLGDCDASGFRLLDIVQTSISNGATSGTDTSGTAWSDIDQVVLFGGFHGGGVEWEENAAVVQSGNSGQTRLYPTSTNTLNWTRDTDTDTYREAITMTTFVIEWGSEWTVQYANVSATIANSDGCDATGEYHGADINSVARANTWVWGTGISNEEGIGDTGSGTIVTLGDGVNKNTNESRVSWCGEYATTRNFDMYVMTHSGLSVDYQFKADGDTNVLDKEVTMGQSATDGYRFGWVTNGCAGSGTAHPRDRFWARYTADNVITISRGYDGQPYPAWVEGIDFSGITYLSVPSVEVRIKGNTRIKGGTRIK